MTVAQGCALLAAAFIVGAAAGFAYCTYRDTRDLKDIKDDMAADAVDIRFRKGGPPTSEATSNTDTPGTTDAS